MAPFRLIAVTTLAWLAAACFAQELPLPPPSGEFRVQLPPLSKVLNEQVVMIPAGAANPGVELETTIFKPPGAGPFPLLVMNHGKRRGEPHEQPRARFLAVSREFVKRGYAVVIPMRKGFSKSGGRFAGGACNMTRNGQSQADDVQATLDYMLTQPWVDKDHILVGGQSHGGLTAMAFGTRNFPGVKGLLNFAGGLRKELPTCQWKKELVDAFADFGGKTKIPSLWFYGENDSLFDPELATQMFDAYQKSGGHGRLVKYGKFKSDAHAMSASGDGVKVWWPEVSPFLASIGMPIAETVSLSGAPLAPKTDFAALDNVDAVPYLKPKGRDGYRVFLTRSWPRAFALSTTGVWAAASGGDDPATIALSYCQKKSPQPCHLYAVDDDVVWKESR